MNYYLSYLFKDSLNTVRLPEGWDWDTVKHGFFLDESWNPISVESTEDCVFWIPAASLRLITKAPENA